MSSAQPYIFRVKQYQSEVLWWLTRKSVVSRKASISDAVGSSASTETTLIFSSNSFHCTRFAWWISSTKLIPFQIRLPMIVSHIHLAIVDERKVAACAVQLSKYCCIPSSKGDQRFTWLLHLCIRDHQSQLWIQIVLHDTTVLPKNLRQNAPSRAPTILTDGCWDMQDCYLLTIWAGWPIQIVSK